MGTLSFGAGAERVRAPGGGNKVTPPSGGRDRDCGWPVALTGPRIAGGRSARFLRRFFLRLLGAFLRNWGAEWPLIPVAEVVGAKRSRQACRRGWNLRRSGRAGMVVPSCGRAVKKSERLRTRTDLEAGAVPSLGAVPSPRDGWRDRGRGEPGRLFPPPGARTRSAHAG